MADRISQARLKELLDYDPETGVFTRRHGGGKGVKAAAGDPVGTNSKGRSLVVQLDGKAYQMHNLAWLWVHGEFPEKQLLKLDGNGLNCAIANLALPGEGERGELTQERLKQVLSYDRSTGTFLWKIRPAKNVPAGSVAGRHEKSNNHLYITVDTVEYLAQRLAWLHEYGEMPERYLRFLDGNQRNLAIENLALPEFDARTPEGRRDYQRTYRQRHFDVVRASDLRKDFGISADVYRQLYDAQGGLCAICGRPETAERDGKVKWLAVDHCHQSNAVRGLLCQACNVGLGAFEDNAESLAKAVDYVRKDHSVMINGEAVHIVKKGPS